MTLRSTLLSFACIGIAASMGCGPSTSQLRTRAAFDFECPEDKLTLTELDTFLYGVTGCEQRGVYVVDGATGAWILNTNDQRAAGDEASD